MPINSSNWLARLNNIAIGWWRGLATTPPDPAEIDLQTRLNLPAPITPEQFPALLTVLQRGAVCLTGQPRFGSNDVYFATVSHAGRTVGAVYKPTAGERRLVDFPPHTLAQREAAAYLLSQTLGWPLLPPTLYRADGPHGPGALQLYIPPAANASPYFQAGPGDAPLLRQVALFDELANNADRKPNHLRRDPAGRLWSIDHGLCFHRQPKRRTFIRQFDDWPLPAALLDRIDALHGKLSAGAPLATNLSALLAPPEITALHQRAAHLLTSQRHSKP